MEIVMPFEESIDDLFHLEVEHRSVDQNDLEDFFSMRNKEHRSDNKPGRKKVRSIFRGRLVVAIKNNFVLKEIPSISVRI
jgi:hypothetical protein